MINLSLNQSIILNKPNNTHVYTKHIIVNILARSPYALEKNWNLSSSLFNPFTKKNGSTWKSLEVYYRPFIFDKESKY